MRSVLVLVLLASPLAAQVNPSGQWRTLHTQHFRIHFRPESRAIALDAAAEAERAYALLATELHPPRGVVDLTLSDDADFPNGFATTYPSNRITLLTVPPVSDPGLQNFDSWRRLVIVHELTHVFHLDRSRRFWGTLQRIFGRVPGLFPNQYQPSWVVEGLATYYESKFTGGGRAEGSFHREVVAADAVPGAARSPWDALLFTRWPGGLAPYAYGSRFWDYLARTAGDSIVPRFTEATAGQLIPFRVGRPLRRIGAPHALTEDWRGAIAEAVPRDVGTNSHLLAGRLRTQPVPRVAPDGHIIAYVYDDGRGARRLRVVDVASGAILRSHRVTGQVSYDWLGDSLVIAQLDYSDRWTQRSDLWRWLPNGTWQRMTSDARITEPRAGGGLLATLQLASGENAPAFVRPSSQVMEKSPVVAWGPVAPSPDGRWLVASRHQNGHWALVRWPAGSPDSLAILAEPPGGVSDASWSGNEFVLYVSDVDGFPQIHRWSARGSVQITTEPFGARTPATLADGTLLFTTLGREGWELRSVAPRVVTRAATTLAPVAFDSAPRVPIRETGYAPWPSLRPYFWVPFGVDAAQAGRFFGAATAGEDAVGRSSYFVAGQVSGAPLRAQGTVAFVTRALGDPTIDVYASNDWGLVGIDSTLHVVSAEHREAALGATVVALKWRSFVSLRLAAEYEGRRYVAEPETTLSAICVGCKTRDRVGGSAGLSFGSAVAAPLSVSLQDGATVGLLYRRREEQGTARWLNEVRARGALYARLGPRIGYAYPVLALRIAAGAFDGPISDLLSVGGVSSGTLALGFGQLLGTARTFPVRGYRAGTLRGRRAAAVSAEYRMPLALVGKSIGHLPLGIDKLAVAVFGDVGDAWAPGEDPRLHRLRSAGVELIGDVTMTYDLPLRARVGVAQPATGHPQLYAAFGADF